MKPELKESMERLLIGIQKFIKEPLEIRTSSNAAASVAYCHIVRIDEQKWWWLWSRKKYYEVLWVDTLLFQLFNIVDVVIFEDMIEQFVRAELEKSFPNCELRLTARKEKRQHSIIWENV